MSNDADCPAKSTKRMSSARRPPRRATVQALEAQIVQLEGQVRQLDAQIAALLADVATLEAACQAMRRRLAGRHLTPRA